VVTLKIQFLQQCEDLSRISVNQSLRALILIKNIARIKGLGVYGNYTKPNDTQDFGVKNLIYGWNYSGKTTLSRLFGMLESKAWNPDLVGCSFSFETTGQLISEANFQQSLLKVRVFNSDFVRENLHFEGGSFKPILLLGKESEQAQRKIQTLSARLKKLQERTQTTIKRISENDASVAQAKTDMAKQIRQSLKIDPYTATQLNSDVLTLDSLPSQLLTQQELDENFEIVHTPLSQLPSSIEKLIASLKIKELHQEAVTVLSAAPSFSNTIKLLEENPDVERWAQTGLELHQDKSKCEFCGNDLSEGRISELRAHFSKDLDEHKKKVANLLSRVQSAHVKLTLPKEAEFNPQFRSKFNECASKLPDAISVFNKAVDTLVKDVQRKVDAPLKASVPNSLSDEIEKNLTRDLAAINAVIDENNQLAIDFPSVKKSALQKSRYHYVQEFIDSQKQLGIDSKNSFLRSRQTLLQSVETAIQVKIDELQALISQAQLGREKINERLTFMFGSEAVRIAVIKDGNGAERFQLIRKSGKVAKNLSDGERTAIAFSYFLTKLQELPPQDFEETIVYIDDPISSLDANHLFQVTAAIKEAFFCKKLVGKENVWTTRCKQFFLSTHNFQFFDLIRELEPKRSPRAQLYFLRKINASESVFGGMPISLCKYSSEYHFLFETIYKFRESQDKSAYDGLMLLPNAVRRFTELYTYSRIPTDTDGSVDRRAERLFSPEAAKRILKILHYFSHANNIERFAGNTELIFDLEHAVNDLLSEIEQKDPTHWDALLAAVTAE
jgi:wobble nucleotide-excising tRNase